MVYSSLIQSNKETDKQDDPPEDSKEDRRGGNKWAIAGWAAGISKDFGIPYKPENPHEAECHPK